MGDVKYLLDTHTLLWAAQDESRLSSRALEIIENIDASLFVSAISAYEIMYKHQLGKLSGYAYIAENYFDIIYKLSVNELPISAQHTYYAGKIEWAHRDPFDRLLAAQAATESMTLITNDPAFETIPWLKVLW